jgi:hypothetical protein
MNPADRRLAIQVEDHSLGGEMGSSKLLSRADKKRGQATF